MKTTNLLLTGLLISLPAAYSNSSQWTGEISATQDRVEVGQTPDIAWTVNYPSAIDDLVDVEGDDVTTKTQVKIDVRVLGAAWGTDTKWYKVQGDFYNGSEWVSILDGWHPDVDPTEIVHTSIVEPGVTVGLQARGSGTPSGGDWYDWRKTSNNSPYIETLVDGSSAPQYDAGNSMQSAVEDYLAPVLDQETGKIDIGPRDVIYLVDFNSLNSSGFDLQDIAVLVTFTDTTIEVAPDPVTEGGSTGGSSSGGSGNGNNGHGNNVDGVDMSNPGNSKSGEDSDPTVDDEKKGGNGKGKWGEDDD